MCFSRDFVLAIQHSILCHNRLPLIHPCPSNYIYMLVNEWSVKNMTPEETASNATLLFIV
jgi:hypothetical protein